MQGERRRLGVRGDAGAELHDELLVLLGNQLLDGTALERLAVAGAFDPPGVRRSFLRLDRQAEREGCRKNKNEAL